jgi:hypothetical protein
VSGGQSSNWRTETNAGDYFGHQQRKLQIADRRPVIRKGSDLVGPGIGANAIRITDFNDLLATYNGYFGADAGAANAPPVEQPYVGITSSDSELGGVQVFYGLVDSTAYRRTFERGPYDPGSIYWSPWKFDPPDTDWVEIGSAGAPAFQGGWGNYGGGWETAAYMRKDGMTYLRGFISGGTVTPGTTIFELEAGYRPGSDKHQIAPSGGGVAGVLNIYATGAVKTNVSISSTWISLANVAFLSEN